MKKLRGKSLRGLVLVCIIISLLAVGCDINERKTADSGSIKDSIYSNEYFGMSIQMPEQWNIVLPDKDTNKESNSNETKKAINLVAAFKYPASFQPGFNPSFICMADNIQNKQDIKTGMDYMSSVKAVLSASQLPYEFQKDIYTENIGGIDFYILEASINSNTFVIKQKSYTALIEKYALVFSISYSNDLEYEELNNVIQTIKFN